ncbi:Uncharacterised protein [Orientia tsutsugamushi]|uniref:Uncharacterized protein n=1 Tax=Orientia tsutsugamushi TaxID=784 RepID=A0A2R8EZL2_ORITS|nr:Uncharacterised protein [Orientia tsutsugamushi]
MLTFINIYNQPSTLTINIFAIFVNITKKLKQKVENRLKKKFRKLGDSFQSRG